MTIDSSIRASHYTATTHKKEWGVIHYTANTGDSATARGNAKYFANPNTESSAHFIVDEGDIVYNVVPEDMTAWAVGGSKWQNNGGKYYGECTNDNSISIEMVSHTDSSGAYFIPEKTIENTLALVKELQARHGIDDNHIIRHYDVNGKPCPMCWTNEYGYHGEPKWNDFLLRLSGQPQPTPTPTPTPTFDPHVYYRVCAEGRGWLPEVKDTNDYAGIRGRAIRGIMVKVSEGSVRYRVHIKNKSWLPYVTGYSISDENNGFAGVTHLDKDIDAVEIYYFTPQGEPYKKAKYQVSPVNGNYYAAQYDNETGKGQDGYAGVIGKAIDRLLVSIV